MIPALSQLCSLNSPFERDVQDYAAGGCHAIEVWLTKLETWLKDHSLEDVRRLMDQHEVSFPVASLQGGLLTSQGSARREHWDHFRRRLQLCQDLQIETLVVAADITGPVSGQDMDRCRTSLREAAATAAEMQVGLALEFQSRATFINNLQTAAAVVDDLDHPALGICLDSFHYYTGPSKPDDLALLTATNLRHVQLCDLADVPREFAADAQRILPGDGDIPLQPIIGRLGEIGYSRHISLELMNPQIWQVPALQFGETGITALRATLGISSMGSGVNDE